MIPLFKVNMVIPASDHVHEVLSSGFIGQGPKVDAFEQALTKWMGRTPITTNSATSALTLALKLAGVGPGARVITTPLTCSATNLPILHLGGEPVWADIDPKTGLIDPVSVAERIDEYGDSVKAIIAVDWGGTPCDYDRLMAWKIPVIEDAAHAFDAQYKERPVGSVADYTAFSFQAIKHLTTGDGGALTVPPYQVKRARDLRWFGIDRDTPGVEFRGALDITEAGWKFHMNDINAAIGLANLAHIRPVLNYHRENAVILNRFLNRKFARCVPSYDHHSSWWMFTTLLPSHLERDEFQKWMAERGVTVSQVHWRNDKLSVFASFQRDLPATDDFTARMICLPTHPTAPAYKVLAAANEFFEA